MSNLCIIPARGGSKRIPKKNIREFLGKPIIAYSIETAIKSRLFDEIMVSTDDGEIEKLAKEYGAKVPFLRSAETANDFATLTDVIEEVKKDYRGMGREFDFLCCILATAPLIKTEDLIKGYSLLKSNQQLDSIRPVARFDYPIQRALKMDLETGAISMFNEKHKNTRSQDLEPAYYDSGMFYWMRFDSDLWSKKGGFEISSLVAQDIDTLEDWKLAEVKYKNMR